MEVYGCQLLGGCEQFWINYLHRQWYFQKMLTGYEDCI